VPGPGSRRGVTGIGGRAAAAAAHGVPDTPLVEDTVRVVLRPVGTPLPLGFLGLAGATFTLAGLQLGWVPAAESRTVGLLIVTSAVPAQLVATGYGFLCRDTIAGTGTGVLSSTWLSVGLATLLFPPGACHRALGLLLFAAATALLVPLAASGLSKLAATAVLSLTALRFLGATRLAGGSGWRTASGATGVVLAAVAVCAAFASELEDHRRRSVVPTLRRSGRALTGSLRDQIVDVHHEAGVRHSL
jgi:uncharacterized protein